MLNKRGLGIQKRKSANDEIYTPKPVALRMIEMCQDLITEDIFVLDPSKGGGVFFDNLPDCNKSYCEITEGKDFFDYNHKCDLIIGNPPYSKWDKWIEHTMNLTDKFCYIFGFLNMTDKRLRTILENGYGLTKMHLLKVTWWFGPTYILLFEKGKDSIISVESSPILCDICGTRCKRGRKGYSYNICSKVQKCETPPRRGF